MRNKQNNTLEQAVNRLLLPYSNKAAALLEISEIHNRLSETNAPEGLHLLVHNLAKLIVEMDS